MEVSTLPLLADSEDPTSLRARALSTLKLKRKRPVPKQPKAAVSLPARPIPSRDAFQLDYGNEDSSASQAQPAAGDEKIAADIPEPDASIREEGEISEEDEPPAKPLPIRRPTPTGPRKHREIEAKLSLLDRISDPAPEHIPPRTPVQIFTQPSFQPSPRPPQRPRISPDQVRPNIPLNQSDYDKAKDVILEILGWGVPPEYLVDCGITREMVFYAFSEFNLRRPANLDTTGLIPYTPETIREFIVSQNVGAPNGSSIQPQLPSLSFGSSSTTSTSAPPTPQPQDDLSDMERQRKQELIARKAVLASRKRKTVPPAAPQPPSTRKASPVVHEAIVDDFLKTITPTSESKSPIPGTPPMDVDHPSMEIPLPVDSDLVSKPASSSPEPPPTSTESTTSIFTIPIRSSPEPWTPIDTPKLSAHLPFVPQYPPRRSAKRPVASDFVDAEAFGGHRAGSLGHAQHTNSFVRRKTGNGSFVNVRHTKCVIDLSDTESEAEDDESPFGLPTSGAGVNALSAAPTSVSQALLEKKEREIQRMKDLIAQHEQKSRLKKMTPKVESVKPSPSPSIDASAPVSRPPIASSPTPEDQNPPETPLAAFREPASLTNDTSLEQNIPSEEPEHDDCDKVDIDLTDASGETIQAEASSATGVTPNAPATEKSIPNDADKQPYSFVSYESLFSSYPMLRFSLPLPSEGKLVDRIDRHSPLAGGGYSLSSTSISNPRPAYDLSELRVVTLTRLLDPSKQICQFEVPGGGVCRDTSCEDLHLSRVDVSRLEPSDDDVAGYLCSIAPIPSRDKALSAVQDARLKDPNASLETRFARVMELLCPEPE